MGAHLLVIIDAQGTLVLNLGSRSDNRRLSEVDSRGGTRVKKPNPSSVWVYADAKNAAGVFPPPNKMKKLSTIIFFSYSLYVDDKLLKSFPYFGYCFALGLAMPLESLII